MYETIGWHYVRGYREVTYGFVIMPILLLGLINLIVGLVLAWIVLERTPVKSLNPPLLRSAPPAVSASFLASAAIMALSLIVVPVLGPALNHWHLIYTPLSQAALYQDESLVISKVLAGENPNVKAPVTEATPLHCMVGANRLEATRVLLEHGSIIDTIDQYDRTALHWAIYNRVDPRIVEMLLKHGASTSPRDSFGKTPLDYIAIMPDPPKKSVIEVLHRLRKIELPNRD
jgi:Ankyrin repeats (3 copies)